MYRLITFNTLKYNEKREILNAVRICSYRAGS